MSSEKSMYELQFKTNKNNEEIITGNILNPKLTKSFQNQKQKISTVKEN